jgi:hypothetical protein
MAVIEQTFAVEPRAIGRADYSSGVEVTTEPFVTSWQSGYNYASLQTVPAAGTRVVNVAIPTPTVVLLYDFFCSIPSNKLIRMVVETFDIAGTAIHAVDKLAYQAIAVHISKGIYSVNSIRFTLYNYAALPENEMVIGCAGMYTTLAEFLADIDYFPAP